LEIFSKGVGNFMQESLDLPELPLLKIRGIK
jgi:hypothetical protein